ncbi:Hint domain-containing protein [Aurantimonas sp. 22II-16-19i]|uniref:Hint domain-containing protein n=1 Tax=Aurantimonas sp. 22II-16-19i TaxID=1317114 RepID=UPI001FD9203F|nr:Hint domain-containing protein [Aurantimonas sp. 22II-16-19i]
MTGHKVTNNGDGTFTVDNYFGSYYYFVDISDSPDDDLTILGDITNDTLDVKYISTSNTIYFGATFFASNANGIVVSVGGGYFLYSYNTYNYYEVINASSGQNFAIQCFTSGVRIETPGGPVGIEALCLGDMVLTASGGERPVTWIGKRTIECSGERSGSAPVQVRADAFGAGVPERDVRLSPGHPVLVKQDGREVLVPIMNLINGTTIERTEMPSVTYWHIELDQHDILLADGLPAESFFDMGSRGWFDNDLDDVLANPDLVPAGQHGRCRDVAIDGPLVEAERKRLADLFYADLSAQCAWPVAGHVAGL